MFRPDPALRGWRHPLAAVRGAQKNLRSEAQSDRRKEVHNVLEAPQTGRILPYGPATAKGADHRSGRRPTKGRLPPHD